MLLKIGLLITAFLSHILCSFSAELAYFFAYSNDKSAAEISRVSSNNDGDSKKLPKLGVWGESLALMRKHPTLQILFMEAIFHQLVGNMLNLMFHDALRLEISDDDVRASLVSFSFSSSSFFIIYSRHDIYIHYHIRLVASLRL